MKAENFYNFLTNLKSEDENEGQRWNDLINTYNNQKDLSLFWYVSSGMDTRPLAHFSDRDTLETYKTPSIGFFVYSDNYEFSHTKDIPPIGSILYEDWHKDGLINGVIKDAIEKNGSKRPPRSQVKLSDRIPLSLPTNDKHPIKLNYLSIDYISDYFGFQNFRVLCISKENRGLIELWNDYAIRFTYICTVCDGCQTGRNLECENGYLEEYLKVMEEPPGKKFWITDHNFDDQEYFKKHKELRGWGNYSREKRNDRDIRVSYLYRELT